MLFKFSDCKFIKLTGGSIIKNFDKSLPTKDSRELYDEKQKLPKLFRTYNRRQFFELLIGLATLVVRGIGILFLIASLMDLYFFSTVYKVRNMHTGETFLMERNEWSHYRKLYKEQNKKA
ncbi:hypothetical protein ACFQAV_09425 [Companilactobacillus huachuanensis]|uniref:Uncharacterized protein n=1 Tax=Companilactobacillus huachuanensis TaxID=2559914 RepID=A0ABW1RNV0_9LACO|nr:hypothetical protein [Companilactobacillus huachuanensis]